MQADFDFAKDFRSVAVQVQNQTIGSQGDDVKTLQAMTDKNLAIIYELLINLAYSIFVAAIALTVAYDSNFGADFQTYIQEPSNRGFIIALIVFGTLILAANKVRKDFDNLQTSPTSRKYINLIEDILRGIVFILLLILVSPFVLSHYTVGLLMASYLLYIIAGALFLAVKLIKWIYFLCCGGKGNDDPWRIAGDSPIPKDSPAQKILIPSPIVKKLQDAANQATQTSFINTDKKV